ncbi:receptor-interacting serine/threonine-protein kinase 2-like isoform X1 [Silurus asotus]|uniref:Receptor-interacting serine/threonine-protein kinase 2-like isoform X1 n=1 Tax=Silurus asotus TaxID=30991 RepID=A0AAD5FGJ5_SILAS|nr:receptor-interacting serine/threonine-protein kinase 2-like isoform X1 [Silurus asotus]
MTALLWSLYLSHVSVNEMAAVLEQVDEAELIHVALVRSSGGTCLRGHLRKSARAVALKLLKADRCLLRMQHALAQGGVCVERVLQPVGVYRSRFLTGLLWDWMPEGSLHSLLYETHLYPDLPLVLRLQILLDVAEGINVLHAVTFPHGALKTTNVLLDHQYRAKLCDWGQQTQEDVRTPVSNVSAPCFRDLPFIAPEVLLGNAPCIKCDMYSFGVLMWETLNRRPACESMDQLQNLVMCTQDGAETGTEVNLLPPETPQRHTLTQLITRCLSVDPKQRPLAEECVLVLRKILETLDSEAHCTAVHQIKTSKERAQLNSKHTPTWDLLIELNNLEGYGSCTGAKHLRSKNIPVTVSYSHQHSPQTREMNETILTGSPPFPTPTRASPPTPCCRDVLQSPLGLSSSNPGVRHCSEVWGINRTQISPLPNTLCSSPMSPPHTPLHPANRRTAVCPISSGWTCCQLLRERREAIVNFMTEGRLNNLLDVLRARRAVTREDYELIMAAMTLSARTRCLLDTCACLGEKVAFLVVTTLGLVSVEAANGHTRSRISPKGQAG